MADPIRILHVVVNMNRGGAETLLMNIYRHIDRTKVQFDFLTFKEGVFDAEIIRMGGLIHRVPYVTDVGHFRFRKELTAFFKAHRIYRIIHCHMDRMSGIVLSVAQKLHVPVRIAHSHNTRSEGGRVQRMYKWYASRPLVTAATHLYACSNAAASWLFGRQSDNAVILKNGIDADKFHFSHAIRKKMRAELDISDDFVVIGHVGRFAQQKNHLFLLHVFAKINLQLPNTVLVLAGDGPLKPAIRQTIKQLNLTDKVKLIGVRPDIHHVLQLFDLFVFPSLHEGLPVTLIEAQSAGLPCIIADTITSEVDLGVGLITRLSLNDTQTWVQQIVHNAGNNHPRYVIQQALLNKGYDIKQTAAETQHAYVNLKEMVT